MNWLLCILIGLIAGTYGGFLGLGGGTILVPVLIFMFGLTQHQAQGTALAIMIPPIGLLAALRYYYSGNVNIPIAIFMCIGFFIGGYCGASIAHLMPDLLLKRIFGCVLLLISLRMIFLK